MIVGHLPASYLLTRPLGARLARLSPGLSPRGLLLVGLLAGVCPDLDLLLDTIVGAIRWLAPLSDRWIVLTEVPAQHSWWLFNFIFHWTFLLELALVAACVAAAVRARRTSAAALDRQKLSIR